MNCEKCGTPFKNGEKFCSKCGEKIKVSVDVKPKGNFGDILINVFKFILNVLIKPMDAISEYKGSLSNPIFALILSGVVSLVMVLSNIILKIFDVVRVSHYTFGVGYETSWQFSRITDLNFLELVFRNFFIYAFIIIVIGGVFYLSSLVIKRELDFFKSLTITASSMIPFVLSVCILTPILTIIWSHFVIVSLIGIVYSVSILLGIYNEELKLKGNLKVYYYSINVSILLVILYIIIVAFFNNSVLGL